MNHKNAREKPTDLEYESDWVIMLPLTKTYNGFLSNKDMAATSVKPGVGMRKTT